MYDNLITFPIPSPSLRYRSTTVGSVIGVMTVGFVTFLLIFRVVRLSLVQQYPFLFSTLQLHRHRCSSWNRWHVSSIWNSNIFGYRSSAVVRRYSTINASFFMLLVASCDCSDCLRFWWIHYDDKSKNDCGVYRSRYVKAPARCVGPPFFYCYLRDMCSKFTFFFSIFLPS